MNKQENFQIKLAIFTIILTFILTITSAIISGYSVYYLTNSERPLLTLNVINYNETTHLLSLKINNFRDTPANNIVIYFQVNNSVFLTPKKEVSRIDELYKGNTIIEINLKKIRNEIIYYVEDYLTKNYTDKPENYSIEVYKRKSEIIFNNETNKTSLHVNIKKNSIMPDHYSFIFSLDCDNCKSEELIVNNYLLEYELNLNCTKEDGDFFCKVTDEDVDLER